MEVVTHSVIRGGKDRYMSLDVFLKKDGKPKPIVVFSHGFKGFKDWGHFNLVAQQFAEAGFVFVKFNFSYNGTTLEEPDTFTDLDAFGKNNYSIELDDLGKVIDWVLDTDSISKDIDKEQLNLMGHSRGGGITILKACEDDRVKKIVTWASVGDFVNTIKSNDIKAWKEEGVIKVSNARTKQEMPLFYQLYEDTVTNSARLDIQELIPNLIIPHLLLHGTDDEVVSKEDAIRLHEKCTTSKLLLVEGAGHTFGAKHPFEGSDLPESAKMVIRESIEYLHD